MSACPSCCDRGSVVDLHAMVERPCAMCRRDAYEAWCATLRPQTRRLAVLDGKGRCCGRKPLVYKRDRHRFCTRCSASFDLSTGRQVPNWAWIAEGDAFVAKTPSAEIARSLPGGGHG